LYMHSLTLVQNHPNSQPYGLPPPHPLQHPRQAGLIQQHRPNSPHQSQGLQPSGQGAYITPHPSAHNVPHHQSPYIGNVQGLPAQLPGEATYYTAHPSPYSTNSAAGSYASSGTSIHELREHECLDMFIDRCCLIVRCGREVPR
jgi:hypothetical protein